MQPHASELEEAIIGACLIEQEALPLVADKDVYKRQGSSQVTEQHSAKSEVPYCVTSPTVPAQVTFDGETMRCV